MSRCGRRHRSMGPSRHGRDRRRRQRLHAAGATHQGRGPAAGRHRGAQLDQSPLGGQLPCFSLLRGSRGDPHRSAGCRQRGFHKLSERCARGRRKVGEPVGEPRQWRFAPTLDADFAD
ncbi:hypothetical protein VARIO8X_70094 [Burkholderiales bacterium 8X]|nr:hypothetical protein VARIO8X_70094 [Burkholderiales bacterium 8X]